MTPKHHDLIANVAHKSLLNSLNMAFQSAMEELGITEEMSD